MKEIRLTREGLFEMVWREPLTVISTRYHIKYQELRKIYIDMNIPVPDGGHWSKLRWGKPVTTPPLPPSKTERNDMVLFEKEPDDLDIALENNDKANVCNTDPVFIVPPRLINPDPLVLKAKEYFETTKRHFGGSNKRILDGTGILSTDVQHSQLGRALRIFDTVIKILRSRGHNISFGWKGTEAMIYGQEIGMRLREINKVSEKPRDKYGYREVEPTGRLTFQIGNYEVKTVSDGRKLIEEKIDSIISKLEAEAKQWHDWHLESEIREKERQEQLRIEQEAIARKEKELSDFKSLYIHAQRLHQANIMRAYVSLVEDAKMKNGQETDELRNWVEWARQKISWYDPLINGADALFNDHDRVTIIRDLFSE